MLLPRTYERNAAGEPDKITKEDGSYTRIEYDDAGRVKAERYFDDVDTLLDEVTYLYDLDGNRTQRTSSAGVEDYIYESGSRLTQVLLDGVETQRFEYDENGRVKRIVRDGLDQRLTWDALDRLVRVDDQNFIEDPVDFDYDGQGRRVSADRGSSGQRYVVGPTGNQSLESPHLVHNGAFLTGELVYNGEHALWRYQGDGTLQTRIYLRDAMGSVIGLMDENGQLIESFDYDAFGNVRSAGGEALPEVSFGGDSRFQGMWKDAGTGLYYVRARYYDARTGRFLSRDPVEGQLETPETFYPYVFANGNPYVFTDPRGKSIASLSEIGAIAIVATTLAYLSFDSGQAVLRRFRPRSPRAATPSFLALNNVITPILIAQAVAIEWYITLSKGRPRNPQAQNEQVTAALKAAETILGCTFDRALRGLIHRELHHYDDPGYQQVRQIVLDLARDNPGLCIPKDRNPPIPPPADDDE